MNNTLNHFGLDLDGGLAAAKSVLDGKYRLPVCINAQLGMVWFSSRSFWKRGGVWFSYIHIRDLEEMNEKGNTGPHKLRTLPSGKLKQKSARLQKGPSILSAYDLP
ncbi:competence protein ComK [Peribacillus frigoritolerans]|nr:competence protein ComK [Peribacillus frigoritolerans]